MAIMVWALVGLLVAIILQLLQIVNGIGHIIAEKLNHHRLMKPQNRYYNWKI